MAIHYLTFLFYNSFSVIEYTDLIGHQLWRFRIFCPNKTIIWLIFSINYALMMSTRKISWRVLYILFFKIDNICEAVVKWECILKLNPYYKILILKWFYNIIENIFHCLPVKSVRQMYCFQSLITRFSYNNWHKLHAKNSRFAI